jgi:outer membrane protein
LGNSQLAFQPKTITVSAMTKTGLLYASILFLGMQSKLYAAANESPANTMNGLIAGGQAQQAFELGSANRNEWEGDPQFDFFYGLAALESGSPNEAVFALERVAATAGNSVLRERARLELARAYFVTNNLTAAENLFNAVLANSPPANVRQNIEAFLILIEARRNSQEPSVNWTISSVLGADDNINSATSNGLIDTPLIGQIELNQDGQQTDDTFSNSTASMAYVYPFTRDRSLNVIVNLAHLDNFDTDQFDIDSLRGNIAYAWGDDVNRFRHGLTTAKINLDGSGFQTSLGLNSSWQRNGGNGWYQSASANFTQIRYDTGDGQQSNALRDVNQFLLTGGLTNTSGPYTHSFNIYTADESPQNPAGGNHNGRNVLRSCL